MGELTVMDAPDHVERKGGETDIATCVTADVPRVSDAACQAHRRICVLKGDAILVTRFGMERSALPTAGRM